MKPACECVSQILDNPELAEPLLHVLLWMLTPNVTKSAEFDEVLDLVCARVPGFREWRDEHVKKVMAA
jgi:hypothetical protein